MHRRTALVLVVISAACFGTLGVLTRLAYGLGMEPLPLLVWRFAVVAAIMAAYQAVRDPISLVRGLRDLPRYAALSITGYGAASVCFFFALTYASPSVVAVLLYTYPSIVAVLSAGFLGERFTSMRAMALASTFIGCALVVGIVGGADRVTAAGILLGLGAAGGYAVFNVLSYRWMPGRSRLVLMTYTFGLSALAIAGVASATGSSLAPGGWSPGAWSLLGAIVVVPTLLAVLLYLGGIRRLGAVQAAIVSTTEPLFTILFAWAVLGERLTVTQLVGAALVLGGVVAAEWRQSGSRPVADELATV